MAAITKTSGSVDGVAVAMQAAAGGGDYIDAYSGDEILRVTNGGGGSITVTVTGQRACNHGTTHNGGGSVAAGATKDFGPFDKARFCDSNGRVQVTYSGVASLTVGVLDPA